MTLTISLPPDAASRLEERARAKGMDAQTYATELLTKSLGPISWLEEISGDIGRRFRESGISEDELAEDLEKAKHEMRAERRPAGTMTGEHHVVFDGVVFAQARISTNGPAAFCIDQVYAGRIKLFISSYILQEIREVPHKVPARYGITLEAAAQLADKISGIATLVDDAPAVYTHPLDRDDSAYVNLALATGSKLIISRDRHLLNLMDERRPEGSNFRKMFAELVIMPPDIFARQLREEDAQGRQ